MIQSISVVIPAYNEEERLPSTLERVSNFLYSCGFGFSEVLIVDDGSTDRTAEVARDFAACHPEVRLLQNPGNRGKGYSVRHGMIAAKGDWRLFTDADLSAPIDELEKLCKAARTSGAEIAIGSRAVNRGLIEVHQSFFRETAGKFFNFVMRLAIGLPIHDTQCGFKLFSRRAAEAAFPRQQLDRFGFDVEVLFIARLLGFRIEEVPVRWSHVEGTKVGLWNGFQSFLDLAAIRRNQMSGKYR